MTLSKEFIRLGVPHDDGSCLIYQVCGGRKLDCPFYSAELLVDDSQPANQESYEITQMRVDWERTARRR